jgi:hypothetical protein
MNAKQPICETHTLQNAGFNKEALIELTLAHPI